MELKLRHLYSRREISQMLGGSIQTYLPFKENKVLCGCFNTSERFNPGAPQEVFFGRAEPMSVVEKSAELVYQQGTPIPIFLFRDSAKWEYIGDYRCVSLSRDPALLAEKMKAHPERGAFVGILRFEKAKFLNSRHIDQQARQQGAAPDRLQRAQLSGDRYPSCAFPAAGEIIVRLFARSFPKLAVLYTLNMRTGFVERTGKIEDMNRDFDLQFWQSQSDTQRFAAAWELVVQAFIIKGRDVSQLRLQRTVEHFERQGR